jgi:hypothetical protein
MLIAWSLATVLLVLALVGTRRFRDRPAVAAGLAGVVTWVVVLTIVAGLGVESDAWIVVWLASGVIAAIGAGVIAERGEVMRDTGLPTNLTRGLTVGLVLGGLAAAAAIACPTSIPENVAPAAPGERLGTVEIPALPTVVRERLAWPDHRYGIEVEVTSTALPGGGAHAEIVLVRETNEGIERTSACELDVGSNGRTIEVLASDEAFEVRWPVSPHGESFGGCTYAQSTLRETDDSVPLQVFRTPWLLVVSPFFALIALGRALRLRRRHARIGRSPEVRVNEPGVAVMPDGSPALVSSEIPMGTTIVALRLADVRPDYRADARHAIEEHVVGEKATLLVDLARRVRTLELTALGGVTLLVSVVLTSWIVGAALGF